MRSGLGLHRYWLEQAVTGALNVVDVVFREVVRLPTVKHARGAWKLWRTDLDEIQCRPCLGTFWLAIVKLVVLDDKTGAIIRRAESKRAQWWSVIVR